jgi:hypothetical protein
VEDTQCYARRESTARAPRNSPQAIRHYWYRAGFRCRAAAEDSEKALQRAAGQGMLLLRQQFMSGIWAIVVNDWRYPPSNIGRIGDDILKHAADQSLVGVTANDPVEAVYLVNLTDDLGEP